MFRTHDIHSLTDFQRNTREHIERLKETGRPSVLTVNGRAEVVVQSAEAYQALLDALERAEALLDIHEGFESVARGEGRPAAEVFESIRARARERKRAG
ncbi:MAG TPA: type II toxin-antitoxin system Phd/YefM family antitoxin [Longimicrobium sp.]|nr:type II toxin-antitoxin system Phd/YefM family antitoxin [Longimicrobium sp.]